jgi:hypothetical protein
LSAIQTALREQQQQELSMDSELQGYKKDILKQQVPTNHSVMLGCRINCLQFVMDATTCKTI